MSTLFDDIHSNACLDGIRFDTLVALRIKARSMSRLMTSTDDWIENLYPGADMRNDLLAEHSVTVAEVADATGLSVAVVDGFLNGTHRVDAEFDLRLGRFFGFSAGYFLRLQNSYDLIEAKRRIGSMVEAIQPRFDRAA